MEIDIVTLSSKGQISIPKDFREGYKKGEKLLLIREGESLILKKASKVDENFVEDIEFANRTEQAYQRLKSGKHIQISKDNLRNELEKW